MLQSADKDGTWEGYDTEITEQILNHVKVPVIACGGCGKTDDLKNILYKSNANAAAIGSMAVFSKKGMGVLINFPKRESIIIE
jgi:cyclase